MAFLSDIKDIKVIKDRHSRARAQARNRHGNPGKNKASLFDLDIRVTPEYDGKMLTLGFDDDCGDAAGVAGGSNARLILPPPYGF